MFNLILVDRGRLTNYLWGFIGCATWLIVVIMNHLVGDIFAQIFYVTMQFVGVWVWQRQLDRQEKNEYEEVNARMFTWWQGILAVIATIVMWYSCRAILAVYRFGLTARCCRLVSSDRFS